MNETIEQRICLKFCVANGISCVDSLKMLTKCYGNAVLSKTRTYEWYKAFKEGREAVQDKPRSGRPSTSSNDENIEKVKELMLEDQYSIREMARLLEISFASVQSIVAKLNIELQDSSSHPCDEPTCDKTFANRRYMRAHWLLEHPPPQDRQFLCDRCSLPLADKRKLQLHIEWHERNPNAQYQPLQSPVPQQRGQLCEVPACGRKYVLRNSLVVHYRKMHPGVALPQRATTTAGRRPGGDNSVGGEADKVADDGRQGGIKTEDCDGAYADVMNDRYMMNYA